MQHVQNREPKLRSQRKDKTSYSKDEEIPEVEAELFLGFVDDVYQLLFCEFLTVYCVLLLILFLRGISFFLKCNWSYIILILNVDLMSTILFFSALDSRFFKDPIQLQLRLFKYLLFHPIVVILRYCFNLFFFLKLRILS